MKELIERLKAATGPDRELDREIERVMERGVFEPITDPEDIWDRPHMPGRGSPFPKYTSSVDAALTLVPEGHSLFFSNPGYDEGVYMDGKSCADIHHPLSSGGGPRWKGFGATPSLAICIAALGARTA